MADAIGFVEDLLERSAKATKNLDEVIKNVESIVNRFSKSAVLSVFNTTSQHLTPTYAEADGHDWGAFATAPKDPIPPFTVDVIGSKTNELLAGIEGSIFYLLDRDGTTWHIRWSIPMIGGNEAAGNISGPHADWYDSREFIAGGGSKVPARFTLVERAETEGGKDPDWRTCGECKSLVYATENGRCPGKFTLVDRPVVVGVGGETIGGEARYGPHSPAGDVFWLGHSMDGPNREASWSRCRRCQAVFYDGWDNKGRCPSWAGRPHSAVEGGFSYFLKINVDPIPGQQTDWRFCEKCFCLFYLPHNADSDCADGGQHDPGRDRYVLTRMG